jgi:phosphoglycolate phosphatase-like HAD superfamily hydrolase
MELGVIILDFDGVVLESEGIKDFAFEQIFRAYPRHLESIMQYHKQHSAVVRFEKFHHIFTEILKKEYTSQQEKYLSEQFSQIVLEKVLTAPFVKGAEKFLESYVKKYSFYIASVNPAGELSRIMKERNLMSYFEDIYASPWKKSEAILDILSREECEKTQAVFIGDSYEDYLAAKEVGVMFIGRDSGKSFREAKIPVFPDFLAIDQYLRKIGVLIEKYN